MKCLLLIGSVLIHLVSSWESWSDYVRPSVSELMDEGRRVLSECENPRHLVYWSPSQVDWHHVPMMCCPCKTDGNSVCYHEMIEWMNRTIHQMPLKERWPVVSTIVTMSTRRGELTTKEVEMLWSRRVNVSLELMDVVPEFYYLGEEEERGSVRRKRRSSPTHHPPPVVAAGSASVNDESGDDTMILNHFAPVQFASMLGSAGAGHLSVNVPLNFEKPLNLMAQDPESGYYVMNGALHLNDEHILPDSHHSTGVMDFPGVVDQLVYLENVFHSRVRLPLNEIERQARMNVTKLRSRFTKVESKADALTQRVQVLEQRDCVSQSLVDEMSGNFEKRMKELEDMVKTLSTKLEQHEQMHENEKKQQLSKNLSSSTPKVEKNENDSRSGGSAEAPTMDQK